MTDRIRKNTLLSILISLFRYAYPAVSFVYVARILHPSGLGRVNYASALTSCFAMITGLGMSLYGLRAVAARRQSGLASLASELFLLRGLFGMFAWALFLVFLVIGRETDRALLFIYGFSIPGAIPECEWLYKGNEDYVTLSLISVGSRVLGLAALLLFVRSASDVYAYAWIAVAMGLGAHTAEMIVAQRRWGLNVFRNSAAVLAAGRLGAVLREHLPSLLLFFMMSCAVTVYSQTDTIMLKLFKGDEAVGLYACAAKVKHMMPVITGALFAAAMPSSVELWRHNRKEVFLDLSHRSFHVVLTILTPLALYFFVFAEPCVRLLGGAEYRSAALPMRVLMLAVVSIGLSNIAGGQILISMGQERRLFRAEVIGALCNILMNILLIPAFSVTGAAIATALSETLVAVMTIHSAKGFVRIQVADGKTLKAGGIGCLVAALSALTLLTDWPDLWKLLISACAFGLCFSAVMIAFGDGLYMDFYRCVKTVCHRVCPSPIRKGIRVMRGGFRSMRYRIDAVLFPRQAVWFCPCCGTRLRGFASGLYLQHPETFNRLRYQNMEQRVNCPVCGALPRHRILAAWCDGHRDIFSGQILYFALEESMGRWLKRNHVEYRSADLYRPADLQMDIEDTGQRDGSWDWIICNHVLEHVRDYKKALGELWRILKPGGHLICSFPIDEARMTVYEEECASEDERILKYGQSDHLRVFGIGSEEILRDMGFVVSRIEGDEMPDSILPVTGPADYDVNYLFLCEKPISDEQTGDAGSATVRFPCPLSPSPAASAGSRPTGAPPT